MTMVSNWPNAIAHIDCDAFYASCEMARRPDLKGRPICVLSSQNAIVVAKSYDAKALGITTGMPVWEAKKLAPHAEYLAADFRYYGQISDKMFAILRRYSPEVEVYSIDEGFMEMNGIRTLWRKSFRQLADDIRLAIVRETGITASVGVSVTRTLAKMASESNKPNGTTVIPGKRIERFLADIAVAEIPGIGRNRTALLRKFGVHTALQFTCVEDGMMTRLLGRHGLALKRELCGISVTGVETEPPLPKSVARTASIGQLTTSREIVSAHLSYHTMRLVSELVAKHLLTRHIHVFLTLATFERNGADIRLEIETGSLRRIMAAVKTGFAKLFRAGESYRGCGVVATHISHAASATPDLFGFSKEDTRQLDLMLTVNRINKKYGDSTVSLAAIQMVKGRKNRPRFHYPLIMAG
ncbi:DNA polymerase-4/DNA polymerase V [Mariprofundus ferrinatatus]|uniref:DNA polymerase-4/DNA polymerase V n=1 Tax=Mariprofundus ferrinatatus TaxID=1921087 RepID=A0A2K8L7X2_9PROT|nr:DNA polymerase IV [Mariprofundus ferrinatatus]ATX82349.1 DNA polymerase-4/DNA polymerase V [Mariprofundus ferrinatatus]